MSVLLQPLSAASVKPLISIVVPVFNVEDYVEECLDGLRKQTYEFIEIIIVDDGSTDLSGVICDSIAELDQRITVIHKANGGLSDARNVGLSAASGSYVSFVDPDDVVSPVFLEALYSAIVATGSVISALPDGVSFHDRDRLNLENNVSDICVSIVEEDVYQERMLHQRYATGIPWRLYSRACLGDNPFPIGIYFEDLATAYRLIHQAGRVAVLETDRLYAYRLRRDSIIRQEFKEIKLRSSIMVSRQLYGDICSYYPQLTKAAATRCFSVNRLVFAQIPYALRDERKTCWMELKKYRNEVLHDSGARKRERLAAFISVFGQGCFFVFCKLARKLHLIQ